MAKKKNVSPDEDTPAGGDDSPVGDKKRRAAGKPPSSGKPAPAVPKDAPKAVPASADKLSKEVAVKVKTADGQILNVAVKIDVTLTVRTDTVTDLSDGAPGLSLEGLSRARVARISKGDLAAAEPTGAIDDAANAVLAAIGGMQVQPDPAPRRGTATIACVEGFLGRRVLLTASHVVGRSSGNTVGTAVTVSEPPSEPGEGERSLPGKVAAYMRYMNEGTFDVALIEMDAPGDVGLGRVRRGGQELHVNGQFAAAVEGAGVIHAGIVSGSTSAGRIIESSESEVEIDNELIAGKRFKPVHLIRIEPVGPPPFAAPGDSGAPILVDRGDGTFDIVGLLIASDGTHGYAYRVTGQRSFANKWQLSLTE